MIGAAGTAVFFHVGNRAGALDTALLFSTFFFLLGFELDFRF